MSTLLVGTRKSRLCGRTVLLLCLNCVQSMAPDWPLLILWPCRKAAVASSIVQWSRSPAAIRKESQTQIAIAQNGTAFVALFAISEAMVTPDTHRKKLLESNARIGWAQPACGRQAVLCGPDYIGGW
jgi:hypothetical protein